MKLATIGMLLSLSLASPALAKLEIESSAIPSSTSAHGPAKLCFVVHDSKAGAPVVFVSFEGPKGALGGKPGLADGETKVCFDVPAVPNAGKWRGCQPPPKVYQEAYLVTAKADQLEKDAPADGQASLVWNLERIADQPEPQPEDCRPLDGDWTFTFYAGVLECAKLPMKVTLPGFSSAVTLVTDGATDTEGLQMTITGAKTLERLKLLSVGEGKKGQTFAGYQDISKMLEAKDEIRGKYSLELVGEDRLEGRLEVDRAPYQGDVCSIRWPFEVTRGSW